jgi:hypothetical protein
LVSQTTASGARLSPDANRRYIGYPGFISFIASDPELLVVRRFDELHTRALLFKQDQVSELGECLKELDEKYITQGNVDNGTFRGDMEKRQKLHEKLFQTLLAFGAVPDLVGWDRAVRLQLLTEVQINCLSDTAPCIR